MFDKGDSHYPRVEHQEVASFWYSQALLEKHQTCLEKPARDKHSSLVRKFVNYGREEFYIVGPCSFFASGVRAYPSGAREGAPLRFPPLLEQDKKISHVQTH